MTLDFNELDQGARASMGHNVVYKEQILPIAQDPFQNITTVVICQNILLRTGISHILSGTRFDIAEQTGDLSSLSTFPEGLPVLFLICDGRSTSDYVQIVKDLKGQYPHARIVALTDTMDPQEVAKICKEGLDGLCTTTESMACAPTSIRSSKMARRPRADSYRRTVGARSPLGRLTARWSKRSRPWS